MAYNFSSQVLLRMKMWILKLFDPLIEGSRLLYVVSEKLNVSVNSSLQL